MLPDELVWVMGLLGVDWPDVDEDRIRETGTHFRQYADSVEAARQHGDAHIGVVPHENEGAAAEALTGKWANRSSPNIGKLHGICYDFAEALDVAAAAVETAKCAVIAQLAALAVEVVADQAGAIETFGLTEALAAAQVTATRVIVRDLLKALEKQLIDQLLQQARAAVTAGVAGMVGELVFEATADMQGTARAQGGGHGLDVGRALGAGVSGTVGSVRQSAASYTTLDGLGQHAEHAAEGAISATKDDYSRRGAALIGATAGAAAGAGGTHTGGTHTGGTP
jgi:hypothetical protein